MEVILPNTSLLQNTLKQKKIISWSRTWSISCHLHSLNWQNCSHKRTAKHIKISCLPRESFLNHSWPSWILPRVIRDIHISPRLSCPWFLAEPNRSIFPRAFTSTSECPDIKTHNRLRMFSILHPTDFAFFSLLQRIGSCLARARQQILSSTLAYYVPVNSKTAHAPPGKPPGIWLFLKNFGQIPRYVAGETVKCPTRLSFKVGQIPHPPGMLKQLWNKFSKIFSHYEFLVQVVFAPHLKQRHIPRKTI